MANGSHTNRLLRISQLIENSIGADAQRVQPAQLAPKRMARMRFALQQAQCVLDRVDQRPVEFK
jgi:hypothetical protein